MTEKNYDFRSRHWQLHRPGRRDEERTAGKNEVMLDESWKLGCPAEAPGMLLRAVKDFQDYLLTSMGISLCISRTDGPKTMWIAGDPRRDRGFQLEATPDHIGVGAAETEFFRAVVHLEDIMNLEGAPVLALGTVERKALYGYRAVHSGCGIDEFPDAELAATVHGGYDAIVLFVKDFDRTTAGYCNIADVIERAANFGLRVFLYNYIGCYHHPDEPGAQAFFDATYGELFRRYPGAAGITLCGESLEFPSRDSATTGKRYDQSVVDGIPDTRPSPGWYPCEDYPAYLGCIERAVHCVAPDARIVFSTYNWGYAPLELRRRFLEAMPPGIDLSVCYEIFSERTLEGLKTPVMDYTISAVEPGYYFTSESAAAHELGIAVQGNTNIAGIAWDFGCVPYVPTPGRWLARCRKLREAKEKWGVNSHYATHHYGWWNSVAADIGKWTAWEDFEPDYDELLRKIAVRDYGRANAPAVLAAWKLWDRAMDYYTASNEDQYGPWRVGAAYPFIFQPNITRTMQNKEIRFPTAEQAHFGYRIVKTLYQPFENAGQSPGFLRYPAELRSLEKMLALWEQGVNETDRIAGSPAGERLKALGRFIGGSIRTTMHIKRWWQLNMALQTAASAAEAEKILDEIEQLADVETANVRDTLPAVETDSRLGWEPSMEYVCDKWHLEWKLRQLAAARDEIAAYRRILSL